jgi:hypothetical protein
MIARLASEGGLSGDTLLVGNNRDSNPGPNTGTPPGNVFPVKILQLIGTPPSPVVQTNQVAVGWGTYKERTVDDTAEAFSFGVILTSAYGGFSSPQTLPVVGLEGDALTQGSVVVSNKVIAVTGGVRIQDSSHADSAISFYSAQTVVATGATVTSRYGFYDEGVTGPAPTNSWSFYGKQSIQTEDKLFVNYAGPVPSSLGQAMIVGPNVSGGEADIPSLIVRPGAGQTAASLSIETAGALRRIQMFGASGNILIGAGPTGGSGIGIISLLTTTAPTGTPPAASAYLYVDPADNKLKAKTSGGTVTVLTPTA